MSEPGVLLQYLRDFTVQIRRPTDDAIVGTGIAVSTTGQIVTCAHVVETALGLHPRHAGGAEVGVYFPQARGGEEKARRATVAGCFQQHDDDVVLLQLQDRTVPLGPEQIPTLGKATASQGHEFRSYGYASLEPYLSRYVDGKVMGPVEIQLAPDTKLQADLIELRTRDIRPGISGAPVLDTDRNLVVGLISERWNPAGRSENDNVGWAVDAHVLTFDPLNLPLRDAPLPKRQAPPLRLEATQVTAARQAAAPHGIAWNGAPPPLPEWVGRRDLLDDITRDWSDPQKRVTGLIGFGGEGKSSLARRWLDDLLAGISPPPTLGDGSGPVLSAVEGVGVSPPPLGEGLGVGADGIFWWAFYDRPSVDEFFEAALVYMSGGRIDPRRLPSTSMRAQIISAMLGAGRYLFVLDGLEVMQHQEGDRYGLLRSADLRQFLDLLAAPGHDSFCLLTSRAPLLDLMAYTTYTHRDVTRLSPGDGRALLRQVGVVGQDDILSNVVADWDGHALTLGLLGAHLASQYAGDVTHAGEIDPPSAGEDRYQRVHRVLRRYDEHLTDAQRDFLTLFSAFRTPVHPSAFDKVFGTSPPSAGGIEGGLVQQLVAYRILRHNPHDDTYTAHPLIRNHYLARLTKDPSASSGQGSQTAQDAHGRIKDYYLELAGDTPHHPTLDDLAPLIEVVHHACRAGAYDEAHRIRRERIYQDQRFALTHQLGAYETALTLMQEFFPDGDTFQEPQVSDPSAKSYILNAIGLYLMSLGRLGEAVTFYERANEIKLNITKDWRNASQGYQNLADLHAHLGALAASADAARQALALAHRAENKQMERNSLARQAWAAHLRGPLAGSGQALETAGAAFRQAEALEREIDPDKRYLYSQRGIRHADHLRRAPVEDGGDPSTSSGQGPAYARRVTEANLGICERNRFIKSISQCHRILGDLDADPSTSRRGEPAEPSGQGAGKHESARAHYDQALKIARSITYRPALIEALLARGRWAARTLAKVRNLRKGEAFGDLHEALGYAVEGGYRVYEADIRVALAWAHLAAGEKEQALQETERAQQMSALMGYHWGQVDAAEVLAALE